MSQSPCLYPLVMISHMVEVSGSPECMYFTNHWTDKQATYWLEIYFTVAFPFSFRDFSSLFLFQVSDDEKEKDENTGQTSASSKTKKKKKKKKKQGDESGSPTQVFAAGILDAAGKVKLFRQN